MEQPHLDENENTSQGGAQRTLTMIGIGILVLLLGIGIPVVLYLLGDSDSSALEKLRDVTVVFIGLLWIVFVLIVGVGVGVLVWIGFQIKNRVVPTLEEILLNVRDTTTEVTATAKRARGTGEFVSESLVTPVISTLGTFTRLRKTATMFVTKPSDKKSKTNAKGDK